MNNVAIRDQKSLKSALNEALSKTVKQLQTFGKINGDSLIQSDCDSVQQFIPVLEAAFIHGLKNNYFERQRYQNDLPKPQFWNLICKLSHKDTLEQIRKLTYVRTNVGRCRAWLRLALNEFALSSYLAALLQSSEYAELLERYYDEHALFRDSEQRDIFLSYLQGSENLTFDLVFNSALLDTWTKTPLELSGVIQPSIPRKQLIPTADAKNPSLATYKDSIGPPRSFESLNFSSSNKHEAFSSPVKDSFQNSTESSTSQTTASSSYSPSYPSITVEVTPELEEPAAVQSNKEEELSAILFERHLSPIRRSKRKYEDGRLTPQSRCSSSSSINSKRDEPLHEGLTPKSNRSRTSSVGSHSSVDDEDLKHSKSPSPHTELDAEERIADATAVDGVADNPLKINRSVSPLVLPDVIADRTLNSETKTPEFHSEKATNFLLAPTEHDEHLSSQSKHVEKADSFHEASLSDTSSSHEDLDDIYAERLSSDLSRSRSGTDVLSKNSSSTLLSTLSGSPGYGNSLLCSLTWSSDVEGTAPPSHPVIQTQPPMLNDSYHSQLSEEADLVIREGSLQKKSYGIWRTRWFVLTTTALICYKDRNREDELDIIHLADIEKIEDSEIKKKKTMSLIMLSGDDHQVGATSRRVLFGWVEDINAAVRNVMEHSVNLNAIETTYVMLDSTDADGEIETRSSERSNTSWRSAMRSHLVKIATEKGLDAQNYQCADCAAPIGILYGEARVCHFTGQYYCPQCHLNEEYQIPARMIHNWDFKKHKVCNRSKTFLASCWKEACIDLSRVNPIAYRYVDELGKLLPLRLKLSALYPYVSTCRIISSKELVSILRSHYYMMENPHLYSAYDLQKARGKSLPELLNKALAYAIKHVTTCNVCSSKGFLCEVCNKNEIIYAFQTEITQQCEDCKTVYHKACLPDISKCRKCERRHRRLQAEQHNDSSYS